MNIIKILNGTNKVIITSIFLCSIQACKKEPTEFNIAIANHYFENVYQCNINNYNLADTLQNGEKSNEVIIPKGEYTLSCTTSSNIILSTTILLQGEKQKFTITINEKGEFSY